ncbi:MAG: hypothetical protein KJ042_09460, partial [Deltaproteobacteria bacterium]|nr:hypothetical protein [Deltaproteobacteria bacterium]
MKSRSGGRWTIAALACATVLAMFCATAARTGAEESTETATPAPSPSPMPAEGDQAAGEVASDVKLATPEEFRSYLEAQKAAIAREREALFALRAEVKKEVERLQALQAQLDARMSEIDVEYDKKVKKLTQTYNAMSPEEAKAQLVNLEEGLMLRVIAGMKPKDQAAILALFPPAEAARIAEKLLKK